MSRLIDLSGQRFGRLLAIERDTSRSPKERKYRTLWKCKCDCGKEVVVWANNLVRGHTLSCGCYKIETFLDREIEHGMSDTRLYEIWKGMRRRCLDPKRNSYHNYGGRGIVVCADWENDPLEVRVGHNCPTCRANYEKLGWEDKILTPDPFSDKNSGGAQ